jgi:PAS domain S-box-containing protein
MLPSLLAAALALAAVYLVWDYRRTRASARASALTLTRIRQAVESASDAIGIGDVEGNSVYHNRAHMALFGYSVAELNALPGTGVLFADSQTAEEIHQSIRAGKSWSGEADIRTKDGRRVPCLVRADLILDALNRPAGIFGVFTDISERRRVEAVIEAQRQKLERANKLESLGMLAGGIAHDFGNLLTSIGGNLYFIHLLDNVPAEVSKYLLEVDQAVKRAGDITRQLLTFASGGTPLKLPVAIAALLRESVAYAVTNSTVETHFEIPEHVPSVQADATQLLQVFNNLAVNAVQAMPCGGSLTVRVRSLGSGDFPGIEIDFIDTGTGIPARHLAKIFDPFFTTKSTGSGIGLATCLSIVEGHGGRLTVDSTEGRGTTFRIVLPSI